MMAQRSSSDLGKVRPDLSGIVPVPNWLDRQLNYAYKQRYKARLRGDQRRLEWADREISRLRAKAGL